MNLISKIFSNKSLLFVFIVPAFTDWLFTMLGQSEQYWEDFSFVNEANPFAHFMLSIHPLFFIVGTLIIYLIIALIIEKLKEPFNMAFAFFLMAAHSWGLSSWVYTLFFKYGLYTTFGTLSVPIIWTLEVIYFIIIGYIAALTIGKYISSKSLENPN